MNADLGIVVPSAKEVAVVRRTLPALRAACLRANVDPAQVWVADERPEREGFAELVGRLGFQRVETGGIGNGPARNRAAAAIDADWLLFVDDDVELDAPAVARALLARAAALQQGAVGVIGGLRPPPGTPRWLQWTYDDATINPASASAPRGLLPAAGLAATVLLIERHRFERVGGFADDAAWGWTDARLGLKLEHAEGGDARVLREPMISGVHWYTPTWREWLERLERAGRRLVEIQEDLAVGDRARLLSIAALGPGAKTTVKFALSRLPPTCWRVAVGRSLRKAAAAASLARGVRLAQSVLPEEP